MIGKKLYRYEESINNDIKLITYTIIKETEKTYVIRPGSGSLFSFEKRIYKDTKYPYVHFNEDDALEAFFYRKRKQVHILTNRLFDAEVYKKKSFEILKEKGREVSWNQPIRIFRNNYDY